MLDSINRIEGFLNRDSTESNKQSSQILEFQLGSMDSCCSHQQKDCPLTDAKLVDSCIEKYQLSNVDYLSNIEPTSFPDGLDVEVFSFKSLSDANKLAKSDFDREHVTPFIRNSKANSIASITSPLDYSKHRWSVDEPEDLELVRRIIKFFSPNIYFSWQEALNLYENYPEKFYKKSRVD